MGLLQRLIGGAGTPAIEAIGNVVGKAFDSKEAKLTHAEVMAALAMRPQEWQAEINKLEAQHRSLFVAGWRPCIGWVCAAGLAWPFVLNPLVQWLTGAAGPAMPTEALTSLVIALLGLGAYRTAEKVAGAAK